MKTNQLILAAAALVALAACTKETPNLEVPETEANEIGFKAVATMNTKANDAIITGTTYGTDNTFKVWGWQSPAADYSEFAENAASNFMTNLTISWCTGTDTGRAEAWRNADHYYYWPFTGKIAFLAIHPSDVTPTSTGWDATNDVPKASITGYTISNANKTVDLMFANNEGTRISNGDAPVNMVYKHALSQIEVKVKTNDDYTADVAFDVESVRFNNIDLSGDVAYAWDGTLPTPAMAISWTNNTTQDQNWPYYSTVLEDITNVAQVYGAANLMIPQAAYADDPATTNVLEGTTLTIGYSMEQTGSAKITGTVTVAAPWTKVKEGDTNYDPAVAFSGWEPGKKYVYTLNFKLNEILFNPSVTDWVEVSVSPIDINY